MFNAGRIISRQRGPGIRSWKNKAPPVWLKVPKKYRRQQRYLAAKQQETNTARLEIYEASLESLSKKPYPFVWQALVASLIGIAIFLFGVFLCFVGFKAEYSQDDLKSFSYEEFLLNHHAEQAQLRQEIQRQQAHLFMDREKYDVVYVRNLKNVVYKVFNSNKIKAFREQERKRESIGKAHHFIPIPTNSILDNSTINERFLREHVEINENFLNVTQLLKNNSVISEIFDKIKKLTSNITDSFINDELKSANDSEASNEATAKSYHDEQNSLSNFKFLIYVGPLVMSIGIFFVILSFVVVCELREKVEAVPIKRDRKKFEKKCGPLFRNSRNYKYEKEDLNFFKAVVYAPFLKVDSRKKDEFVKTMKQMYLQDDQDRNQEQQYSSTNSVIALRKVLNMFSFWDKLYLSELQHKCYYTWGKNVSSAKGRYGGSIAFNYAVKPNNSRDNNHTTKNSRRKDIISLCTCTLERTNLNVMPNLLNYVLKLVKILAFLYFILQCTNQQQDLQNLVFTEFFMHLDTSKATPSNRSNNTGQPCLKTTDPANYMVVNRVRSLINCVKLCGELQNSYLDCQLMSYSPQKQTCVMMDPLNFDLNYIQTLNAANAPRRTSRTGFLV
ncbi:hypothetical protein HELRODRAFT_165722 [Helobdella robusta]|uniref:Uncharacterized protein n=1 Tax=Helobdella robusta TaxID=6412 RepID=T1EX75_HELRO|nr:hypothetical protein HELRODRAFT_165722 [Helobdella robusta]ESN91667.1 hypothetical protein HELRODRAFT_165722 [Helobdella robusta]